MAGRRLATRKQASLLRAEETKKETMMGKRGGELVWEDKLLVGKTTPSSSVFVYCILALSLTAFVESAANSYKEVTSQAWMLPYTIVHLCLANRMEK